MLLKTLLDAGILSSDATLLQDSFGDSDPTEFLDGLEQAARALVTHTPPGLILPGAEPWHSITEHMRDHPGDLDQAFSDSLAQYTNAEQVAILGAITIRMRELQQWIEKQDTGGKRRKWGQYIQLLDKLGYKFKYNLCTNDVEVNGSPISDGLAEVISMRARDMGVWEVNVLESAYKAHAWQNRYHPIRDYLQSLKYEGKDAIGELSNYFVDEHGIFATFLRKWLIGAVARAMSGAQNRVLVLDGAQGIGKSEFVKWLASPMPEYYFEGAVNPEDKDCRLRRMSIWIWEINEFGSTTRRADREALKAFLSTHIIRERKAYGKFDIQGNALSSFVGTANDEGGILADPTGSRRFMTVHLLSIDWQGYTRNIDVDQVWAQAYDLYVSGENWELENDDRRAAEDINAEYKVLDIVEETVRKFFEVDTNQTSWRMSSLEIMEVLKDPLRGNLRAPSEINERRLSSAMVALGLGKPTVMRFGSKALRGYTGINLRMLP